jgi:hypothetical protein
LRVLYKKKAATLVTAWYERRWNRISRAASAAAVLTLGFAAG